MKAGRCLALMMGLALWASAASAAQDMVLWHSYRGAELKALDSVVKSFNNEQSTIKLETISIPYEAMASKLEVAIPRGHGPDLFIYAHEKAGAWSANELLSVVPQAQAQWAQQNMLPQAFKGVSVGAAVYGYPLAVKSAALFVNTALVKEPIKSVDDFGTLKGKPGIYPLVYETDSFYFHAPWFLGLGGSPLDAQGKVALNTPAFAESLDLVRGFQERQWVPQEVTATLVNNLFNGGQAAAVMTGPWFLGEIKKEVAYEVRPLPKLSNGQAATPFLTVEALWVAQTSANAQAAHQVARYLADASSAQIRLHQGRQVVALASAWRGDGEREIPKDLLAFYEQAQVSVVMDNRPEMSLVWEPAQLALQNVLRDGVPAQEAMAKAAHRAAAIQKPLPPAQSPTVYLILLSLLVLAGMAYLIRGVVRINQQGRGKQSAVGWLWTLPAMIPTLLLVILPFVFSLGLAFYAHDKGSFTFVGLAHFKDILFAQTFDLLKPLSFYYALAVTILWTLSNVSLHVAIGVLLAVALNQKGLRLSGWFRVILILPWAVPNYITALIWKGMFHKQFGAINAVLNSLDLEDISWFSSFGTAFFANLCTNIWLGFPFMMVVALGALQSIPSNIYEAAQVDGATPSQQFWMITCPNLLKPMIPALMLGCIWTFNQFNIIYLVSGGAPDNSTDILITEAWRWAFARQGRYGYAAAYAALIFVLMLVLFQLQKKVNQWQTQK